MGITASPSDLNEVEGRIAVLSAKRLGQLLHSQRTMAGVGRTGVPGIDWGMLDDFETGRRRPDVATVAALIGVYGCSLDQLVPPRRSFAPAPLSGRPDKEVLEHYLATVRKWRNSAKGELQFREDDLAVLVAILGSDPDEIVRRLVELTGCSRRTAKRLRRLLLSGLTVTAISTVGLAALTHTEGAGPSHLGARAPIALIYSAPIVHPSPETAAASAAVVALPAGSATDYAYWNRMPDGTPYRWDPCQTVTVAYVPTSGAPQIDIAGAVTRLADATGLSMRVVSVAQADITVTFAPRLAGGVAATTAQKWNSHGFITQASVVMSEQTPANLMHEALLHELGHAVGLGHAPSGQGEVMDAVLTGRTDYQAGDLAGLRSLGPLANPACAVAG